MASYILGLLVAVPLLFCELGLSDVGRVITLNIDKNADHSRFIVEKHVIDDVIFYAYYPRLGYQVDCVYSGCYSGWIRNFDLKSDFCYALANYDYVHKDSLFYEIKSATAVYSTTQLKTIFQCPDLQDHLLRASIALKYLKETHYFSKRKEPSLVTKADDTNYVEPLGYVRDANSIDVSDLGLKGLHFKAVSQFIGYVHSAGPPALPSQPEPDPDEVGADESASEDSSRINDGGEHYDDQLIALATPDFTVSIRQETHRIESLVPPNESEESTPRGSLTPTLPPILEDEREYSISSLPHDSSGSLAQQETSTAEATSEEIESPEVHLETEVLESPEASAIPVQPPTESTGSEGPDSTVQRDSEQPETDDSASLVVPQSTSEVDTEISTFEDFVSTVPIENQETAAEDPVQSPELQSQDTIVTVEHLVTDPSGTNEQNLSTVQPGSSESVSEEPSTSVIPDSSDNLESSETSSQAVTLLTEAESSTVLPESEPYESTETSSLSQEGGSSLQVEAEEISFEDTAELTLSQDTRIVQPDSSSPEVAEEIETEVSTEQTGSQDSTPPLSGTSTAEVEEEQDSSEDATSQTHADPSADAAAEPGESEQPTSDQQEQLNVIIDQGVYDESVGLRNFGNHLSVLHYSEDRNDKVQRYITFSDGVTVTYGFFIMHNTPLGTPPDPSLLEVQFSEDYGGSTYQGDEDVVYPDDISDYTMMEIPLLPDEDSDDENEYEVYPADGLATLGEPSSGFQDQPSMPPNTVERTISTEASSLATEVESTVQPKSSSVDVRFEHTSSEDSTEHTMPDNSSISTDQHCHTQHPYPSEVSSEDSDKSTQSESSTDQAGDTEVHKSSDHESEGSTETVETGNSTAKVEYEATSTEEFDSKSNLRATESSVTESIQPSDHPHSTVEEVSENHNENFEDKSGFPTSSIDQHSTPVSDCSIWF